MSAAGVDGRVCVGHLLDIMGERSFGAVLLAPSLIVVSPLSGIPGLSTVVGLIIALIAGQMLVGCDHIWLPRTLRERCIAQGKMEKALRLLAPGARLVDRLVSHRLAVFTRSPFSHAIPAICVAIGLAMPLLEIVPFASSILAAAVAAFALALVARDGALAVVAMATTGGGVWFGANALL
ncbi:MAG: exopolysaccharide biosynthesis protein [Alphaproteobacteria bacterium]|nr:exopolysaccharide biosynthesis protein [Alphaproteobacteria bacterium]